MINFWILILAMIEQASPSYACPVIICYFITLNKNKSIFESLSVLIH